MRQKRIFWIPVLLLAIVLAACSPGASTQEARMDQQPIEAAMGEEVPDTGVGAMMEKSATPEMDAMLDSTHEPLMGTQTAPAGKMEKQAEMESPAWFSMELTNVGSGETFTIADFKGNVVVVQTFAQWCPTCLRQQKEIARLHEMLDTPMDLVTVSLDIDPNEDAAMLQEYLKKHGFTWRYAIPPAETAREIGSLYGDQFLNPPSAPVLVIDRKGAAHPLPFGFKSAEDLQEALRPFLSDGI